MEPIHDISGVILAGGLSSRFGSNKALARWGRKFLIQHVKGIMASVFKDCLLSTNTPEQYAFLNIPMIQDIYQNMGPLAGIHAALRYTAKPWIFVVGCDMPLVTPDLIRYLCGFAQDDYEAVIPWLELGPEPLCGLYHKTALDKIELQLNNSKAQVLKLFGKMPVRKVKDKELLKVTRDLQVFFNINKKQDLDSVSIAADCPMNINFSQEFHVC